FSNGDLLGAIATGQARACHQDDRRQNDAAPMATCDWLHGGFLKQAIAPPGRGCERRPSRAGAIALLGGKRTIGYCHWTTWPSSRSTRFCSVSKSSVSRRNCTLPSAKRQFAPPACTDWIGVPHFWSPIDPNWNCLRPIG